MHYINDSSLSWLDTRTSVESSNICLSGMRRSCSELFICDCSLSWLDTITSVESCLSYLNEAVMQCTIYMTAHYPGLIQELQ